MARPAALLAIVAAFAVVSAGCGAGSGAEVHSPREVLQVFAAHGLALSDTGWTTASGSRHEALLRSDVAREQHTLTPTLFEAEQGFAGTLVSPKPDLRHLDPLITIWTTIPAAKANEAKLKTNLLARTLSESVTRVDNVTAVYTESAQTAAVRTRFLKTLALVASTPRVKSPQG